MFLAIIAFFCGLSLMVVELLGARLISSIYGNSFFVWVGVIGVVMASLSLGYWHGGVLADRRRSLKGLIPMLFLAGLAIILIPYLLMLSCETFFTVMSWQYGTVVTSLASLALPSYLLAIVTPYCVRLSAKSGSDAGSASGRIYSISTVGSIIGVFLSGYVLIPYTSVRDTLYITGCLLTLISTALYNDGRRQTVFTGVQTGLMIMVPISISLFLSYALLPFIPTVPGTDVKLIDSKETQYTSLGIIETNNTGDRYRLMSLGLLVQGGIGLNTGKSHYRYTEYEDYMWSVNPDIRNVLILGNGAAVAVKEIKDRHPDADIDVVDIDPTVFEYASRYFGEREDERTKFIIDDARVYLQKTDKKYDLIFMDVAGATHVIPFHLTTEEMLRGVKSHLTGKGVYVMNIISSMEGSKSRLFKSELKTMETVFPKNYVLQVEDPKKVDTVLVVCGNDGFEAERLAGVKGLENLTHRADSFDLSDGIVLTDDYAPIDNML